MSLGHHDTSPKLSARWSGGVSLGSTERRQPPRCRRDHASSEEEKERVSQLLAGTEKGQEVDVKTLAGTACLSHSAAGTVCADRVQFPHTAPALPSPRSPLYVVSFVRSAVMEVSRCRQGAAAAVWYEVQWSCDLSTPPPPPRSLPLPKMWGVWPKSA